MNFKKIPPQHSEQPEFLPTRWSLIDRLKDWEDQETWREFFQIYSKLIHQNAMRGGCTSSEAEEVVQETIISVARKMDQFRTGSEHGSFKAWLLQMTRRRTIDQLRKRRDKPSASEDRTDRFLNTGLENETTDYSESVSTEAETDWDREWDQALLEGALEKVKTKVNPKHYQIFQLSVLQEQTIRDVAGALDVSCAQVYLVKHRITRMVEKELKALAKRFS